MSERETIFIRALSEKIFEKFNKNRILVSLEIPETSLKKKLVDEIYSAMKNWEFEL